MLHNEMQNCITKTECDQEIIKWDPKYETIKDNRWDPKQILHNELYHSNSI